MVLPNDYTYTHRISLSVRKIRQALIETNDKKPRSGHTHPFLLRVTIELHDTPNYTTRSLRLIKDSNIHKNHIHFSRRIYQSNIEKQLH